MRDFVIIPDSSCDLPKELRQRFDIPDYLRGIVCMPDGSEIKSDLDWGCMTPTEFYRSMKGRKVLYKTATPILDEVRQTFEKYLAQGKDVLSISLSSMLSGGYQSTLLVARELREKYPERKICCVDSLRYSTSLALLVILACRKRDEGASVEETAAYLDQARHTIHQAGPMDDLFFLAKTGRISNFKALFGTLVGVNPMADFNRNGLSEVLVKFKGKKTAFEAALRYMEQTIVEPEKQLIFVAHSDREAAAQMFAQMIRDRFHPAEIILNTVGMSCGVSIGPGLCAAFYQGAPVSEGLTREKEIMSAISAELSK